VDSCVDRVVLIDVTKGTISQIIQVEGAGGLNDISVNKEGVVYVSDSKNKKLFRIENGASSVFIENLKGLMEYWPTSKIYISLIMAVLIR
jgi:hypothetical protein